MSSPNKQFTVISTFSGAGGSSAGYKMAGGKILLGVEIDPKAVKIYQTNFPETPVFAGDIAFLSPGEIDIAPRELDIFDGSPPCQGFSTSGKRIINDPRNVLFKQYVRLLKELKPKTFVMENVSGMIKGKMKLIFVQILEELKQAGYQVRAKLLNAKYYQVPQSRQRVIFIGVRNDLEIDPVFPEPSTELISAKEAIAGLSLDEMVPLKAKEMIRLWNEAQPGKSFGTVHLKGSMFDYKKINPLKPFLTVTTQAGQCHWERPALISIPQLKRASTFPDEFDFGDFGFRTKWKYIGNAVPPNLTRAIAETIRDQILTKI